MDFETKVEKWIHNAKSPLGPIASNEVDEDKTPSNVSSSYSLVRQLKAKPALATLNSEHMSRGDELLRLEGEIKLKLRVLETEHEVLKTDLEGKWSKGEEPALAELPDTFNQPYCSNGKGSKEPLASMPKSGDPERRLREQKPEWRFNPNAREFQSLPFTSSAAPAHNGLGDSMWSQQLMEKVAVTIKQGFALPQRELTVFNGDPLQYWSFITSFRNSIEANATSESEKLMYLLQYISGAAKDTIKCCLVMDPSIGYQRARMLLEERFGQPFTIAYEHVTKLTRGPPLRATDRKGLLAFTDQLKSCEHTLESIGYLDEINSADNLRRIVMRLPFHLRTKFVEVADQIQQSGQRPNISHIAEFVKVKARAANNPVFGCLMDTERDRTDNLRRRPKTRKPLFPSEWGTAFNARETEIRESSSYSPNSEFSSTKYQKCPVCNAAHPLLRWHIFGEKTFEERLQVMRKAQLCHNCFKYSHIAVGCLAKKACDVQGCRRKHHTLIHPPFQPANTSTTGASDQGVQLESGTALQTNSTSAKVGRVCLMYNTKLNDIQGKLDKLISVLPEI